MTEALPNATTIMSLHDRLLALAGWPAQQPEPVGGEIGVWVQANHRNNCLLWAQEDLARRTTVADAEIAANKRAIDGYNQARNDATERVDELLLVALGLVDAASARTDSPVATVPAGARLNSETAGKMCIRDSTDKLKVLLADARLFGLRFEAPDINSGTYRFAPISETVVRYGLGAVKGTGQGAIEAIVASREGQGAHAGAGGGPFRSIFDFCARVDRKAVNKRAVEALVKACLLYTSRCV